MSTSTDIATTLHDGMNVDSAEALAQLESWSTLGVSRSIEVINILLVNILERLNDAK